MRSREPSGIGSLRALSGAAVPALVASLCLAFDAYAASVANSAATLPVPEEGLVAFYPLDGNADDAGQSGLDGLVSGASPALDRFGIADGAYRFGGRNDVIEVPNADGALDAVGEWSVSVWVRPDATRDNRHSGPVVWKLGAPSGNEDNYLVAWGPENRFITGFESAATDEDFAVLGRPGRPLNEWQHVAGIYDGEFLRLFVDGELDGETQIGEVQGYTGAASLRIGNIRNSTHNFAGVFEGAIDDIAIYSRALTPEEVESLAAVPLPPAGWMLLSALAAAGLARRRRT